MLFKIKKNRENQIRTMLCFEDVVVGHLEVLVQMEVLTMKYFMDEGQAKPVVIFKEAFPVPRFNVFYASKIKSVSDPYLVELIKRLLYLNPTEPQDDIMIKRLTEFIVRTFSQKYKDISKVTGREIMMPSLTHEEVRPVVESLVNVEYVPDNEDFVMFSRRAPMSRKVKMQVRSEVRQEAISRYCDKAIHTAAEALIDRDNYLRVTPSRISSSEMVIVRDKPASLRTIKKYMSPKTERIMEEHNEYAPFKTEKTAKKFEEYLLIEDKSLEITCQELNVSKGTVLQFRELRNNL